MDITEQFFLTDFVCHSESPYELIDANGDLIFPGMDIDGNVPSLYWEVRMNGMCGTYASNIISATNLTLHGLTFTPTSINISHSALVHSSVEIVARFNPAQMGRFREIFENRGIIYSYGIAQRGDTFRRVESGHLDEITNFDSPKTKKTKKFKKSKKEEVKIESKTDDFKDSISWIDI